MHVINCKQGTPEWLQARAGVITASEFSTANSMTGELTEQQDTYVKALLSGKSEAEAKAIAGYKAKPTAAGIERALFGLPVGEPSAASEKYAAEKAIERICGRAYGEPPKAWILDRGHEMEEKARIKYELQRHCFVSESGIALTDDRKFGYSTDGLVDDDGSVEVKAPICGAKIAEFFRTWDSGEYDHQMQGGLWITGRKWCDLIVFVPELESVGRDLNVKRIYRDDNFIDAMVEKLLRFNFRVEEYITLFSAQAPGAAAANDSSLSQVA